MILLESDASIDGFNQIDVMRAIRGLERGYMYKIQVAGLSSELIICQI